MSNESIIANIKKSVGAHGAWKLRLRTAIAVGSSEVNPENVRCDNLCEFGKWLYSAEIDAKTKQGMPYQVIKRLHAEFHVCASEVLELALSGDTQQAQIMMDGEFSRRSEKLILALNKWRGELSRPSVPA